MERGKPKKIWLSSNGQTPPSVCGLPFVSLVPLQMAVVKLQRLYHKIGFLPSGYRLRYELGYPFITESGLFMMLWITSFVSFPSWLNFFILIACASDGVASL